MNFRILESLKFQIALALLLFLFLFWGIFTLSLMALEEQRSYNTVLNLATRLEQTAQNLVSLGMNYAMNTPDDRESYQRDIRLYYQEMHSQVDLFEEITQAFMSESFGPKLTNMSEQFNPHLNQTTQRAVAAVEETWTGFRQGLEEALGEDRQRPRLERAARYIATEHAQLTESLDALIAQIQQLVYQRLEQVNQWLWGMLIAAVMVTFGIFFWFFIAVLSPMSRAAVGFGRVAQGDFGLQIKARGNNEIARMTGSFNLLSSRLHALFSLIDRIQRGSDLDETLRFVAEEFPRLLPLDWAGALFLGGDGSSMVLESNFRDGRQQGVQHSRFRFRKTLLLKAIESGEPLHIPDMLQTARENPDYQFLNYLVDQGLRDAIFLPITELSPIPGVLAFATNGAGCYTQEHLELLTNIASLVTHSFGQTVKLSEHARLAAIGEFASGIAHEIRTPLSTISMALDYFRKAELPGSSSKRAALAHQESERMARLLEEILLYSKPLKLNLQSIDPMQIIRNLVETHKALPQGRGQSFEIRSAQQQLAVYGDSDRLMQVFLNLARNACEAAPEGSSIEWNIGLESETGTASVSIRNPGEPISAEQLPHLFRPFYTTKSGGTGLGLSIVKRIIDAHGGDIRIDSGAEQGTIVTVELPLAPS